MKKILYYPLMIIYIIFTVVEFFVRLLLVMFIPKVGIEILDRDYYSFRIKDRLYPTYKEQVEYPIPGGPVKERLNFDFSYPENILTVTCTSNVQEEVVNFLQRNMLIEYLQREQTIEDTVNDQGRLFKNCIIMKLKLSEEKGTQIINNMKKVMLEEMQQSIGHSDN